MAGTRQFQAAADHGAVQRHDHGHRAFFNAFQRAVPHAGVVQAFARVALLQLGQVQPGTEMLALAMDDGDLLRD